MGFLKYFLIYISLMGCSPTTNENNRQNEIINLRFGHDMPITSAQHKGALRLAELLSKYSNGKIQLEIIPEHQAGTDREMINLAQQGNLDFILPPSAKLSHIVPAVQILDVPFLFKNHDQAHLIILGKFGYRLKSKFKGSGLVALGFWESGFKQITSNIPIEKTGDFENQKFRIMSSQLLADQFSYFGSTSIPIEFKETLNALDSGVVTGQENPLSSIQLMEFHKKQKYLYLSNHGYLSQILLISEKTWNSLKESDKEIIKISVKEATDYQYLEAEKYQLEALALIKKESDIKILELTNELRQYLYGSTKFILEKYRPIFGSHLVEEVLLALDDLYQSSRHEWVVGLDADLLGSASESGVAIRRGIELAISEINHNGGLNRKPLKLIAKDNSMLPAKGIDNIQYFSTLPNLIAVFGGVSSPTVLAELPYIHKYKILFLNPWAAATNITNNGYEPNFVYRVSVRDSVAGSVLISEALKLSKKIGLLLVNNPWGRSNLEALQNAAKEKNNSILHTEWFEWSENDFDSKIQSLVSKGAEVIIFVGNAVEGSKILRSINTVQPALKVVSHWGILSANLPNMVGDLLDKVDLRVLQTFSFYQLKTNNSKTLLEKYKKGYSINDIQDIPAQVGTAHAYDLMQLLMAAARQSNKIDMNNLRDEMERIKKVEGSLKTYSMPFDKDNHDALIAEDYFFSRYSKNVLRPIN